MKRLFIVLGLLGCIVSSSFAVSVSTGTKSTVSISTSSSDSVSDSASASASYPTTSYKPQSTTSGPYGSSQGTPFSFEGFSLANFLATLTGTSSSTALTSLQVSYANPVSWIITALFPNGTNPLLSSPLAGLKSGQTTEWIRAAETEAYIVKAAVCTGTVNGNTAVTALRLTNDAGETTTFGPYGRTGTKCVDVSPKTKGYYLDYLSGRASTLINQLTLHWKSDFSQERDCIFDALCKIPTDFCYNEGPKTCCLKKLAGDEIGTLNCIA